MKTFYKLLVSLFLLGLILYLIDFNDVLYALQKTTAAYLIISLLLSHFSWVISGYKLHILYQSSFKESLILHYKSILFSFIFPGQLGGEGYKILKISKSIGLANSTSIVLIDKLTGFIGILILSGLGIIFSKEVFSIEIKIAIWSLLILFIIPFIFSRFFKKALIYINGKYKKDFFNNLLDKILNILESFIKLQSRKGDLIKCILLGTLFQFISVYINYFIGESIGISVGLFDWFWIFGLISMALFLPITYAGFGVREGSMVGLLGIFSVEPEKAIALSFLILALQLSGVMVGIFWNFKKEEIQNKSE